MAKLNNKVFKIVSQDGNAVIGSITTKLVNKFNGYDKEMERRMRTATNLVWRTAHAKRAMMTKAQAKEHGSRVSLPDPKYTTRGYASGRLVPVEEGSFSFGGVPVKTGRLQASVTQKVTKTAMMSYSGKIAAGGNGVDYAAYMEFGTSKVAARPFMRPAMAFNKEAIRRVYGMKMSSNI